MIQPGGALDIVFGWQRMLEDLYGSDKRWKNLLGKALGDCQQCTSFWFMPLWYLCYYAFCKIVVNVWVTDGIDAWWKIAFVNWLWMTVFWSIGAVFGLMVVLFKKAKSGV